MAITFEPTSEIINESRDFDVTLDKKYTVREFINMILSTAGKEKEGYRYGKIGIYKRFTYCIRQRPHCEYKNNKLVSESIPEEFMDKNIDHVTANGGWGAMDFILHLE